MKKDTKKKKISQKDLIREFFKKNPHRDIPHPEVVDWAVVRYKRRTGEVFRDPDRAIRELWQEGTLIKVGKGVYRYEPESAKQRELADFTQAQKDAIFARDGHTCVVCGKGTREGVELHADHIKPKDRGGKATLENGQVLCGQHNYQKKVLNQTETGKKMFIRFYELSKAEKHEGLMKFCADILQTYEKHNINGHIEWEK